MTDETPSADNIPLPEEPQEQPTGTFPANPDFIYVKDFDPNANIEELEDSMLIKYHDLVHIFWNQHERSMPLDFGFNDMVVMHSRIAQELERRGLPHFMPINNLDSIHITPMQIKLYAEQMSKTPTETPEKSEENLTFRAPTVVKSQKS